MAVFTAIAAWVVTAIGATGVWATVASFAVRAFLVIGISKLLSRSPDSSAAGGGGGRVPVNPSTENKLPVLYGTAFIAGTVVDAKISVDQKWMWYVFAMSEVTDTGTISYDKVYWNGNEVTFGTGGTGNEHYRVKSWTTNGDTPQTDEKINGLGFIYLFNNGSSSGLNTEGKTAIDVLSNSDAAEGIPVDMRWTSTCTMDKVAFMIVQMKFDSSKGLTSMPTVTAKMTNTLTKPGGVLYDYMTNTRYGCGINPIDIDGSTLTALDTYSDQAITYYNYPYDATTSSSTRYRINGPIITGNECLTNVNQILDSCDSWLKFNEITSKWAVVLNKAFDQSPNSQTLLSLFHVTDSNLIGGIDIQPTDLNSTYNAVEIQYPNTNIKDGTDYQYISLWEKAPALLSPNEPFNRQTISLPLVNNAVQAIYIGGRRLYQAREEITVTFTLDYSGIQIEAGDIIRITSMVYGWDTGVFADGKLFRVIQVQEAKAADGSLGAHIVASEYNETIYVDNIIQDFIPSDNSGLADPAIIDIPAAPTVTDNPLTDGNIASFRVTGTVPAVGQVLYMDFMYGTTNVVESHRLYRTIAMAMGVQTAGTTPYINVTSFDPNVWYWSIRVRNNVGSRSSVASSAYTWGGPNVTHVIQGSSAGWNSSGTTLTGPSTTGIVAGMHVRILTGVGVIADTAVIANILNSTQIAMDSTPSTPLVAATILWYSGGVKPGNFSDGSVDSGKIKPYNPTTGAGGLGSHVLNPNSIYITRSIGGTNFSIATVAPPVSVLSTSTRNIPVYIPGTAVGGTVIYPYAQGTSSTALFYAANSTAAWAPVNSKYLIIGDGDGLWYILVSDSFSAGAVKTTETYQANMGITLLADANATIQVVGGIKQVSTSPYYQLDTEKLQTHQLVAGMPYLIDFSETWRDLTYGGANYIGAALFCRNMTAGSNVGVVSASLASSGIVNPY